MNKPVKHHYVPQCYLKFFSNENENGEFIIHVFDKILGKEFHSNITDIAEQRYFNKVENDRFTFPTPDGDPLFYEYRFGALIEGRIPQIINNITSSCTLSQPTVEVLTEEIKNGLATMIVVQLFRTPQSRKYTREVGRPISENVISNIRKQIESLQDLKKKKQLIDVIDEFKYTEDFSKSFHLQFTTDNDRLEKFIQILVQNRSWVIYANKYYKSIPFVTSDNPVAMYNIKSREFGFGDNGLDNVSTVISMPLTPKYMVSLYHRECIFGHYSQSYENKCIAIDDMSFIVSQTLLQAKQCSRHIFKKPD